jgi:hypothetical protein
VVLARSVPEIFSESSRELRNGAASEMSLVGTRNSFP